MAVMKAPTAMLATAGEWQLVRKVGEGASSVVYEGKRGTVVAAVKVLQPGFGLEEAALLAHLGRMWGPSWLDAGVVEGCGFVVTEWVEGEPVAGARGDDRALWSVVHAVARAIAELHEAGVRHGDVKPENVMWHKRVPERDTPS